MENNRFFIWIGRINSLVFLLILLLMVFFLLKEAFRHPGRGAGAVITNVAPDPKGEEKWVLGSYKYLQGTDYIVLPLISEKETVEAGSTSSLSGGQYRMSRMYQHTRAKNFLFINARTNEARWLFQNNEQLIHGFWEVTADIGLDRDPAKTRAVFYQVLSADTNKDGIVNNKDRKSLAVSRPDGSGYKVIVDELDELVGESAVDEATILIVHQSAGTGYSSLIDLARFEVLSRKELPRVER